MQCLDSKLITDLRIRSNNLIILTIDRGIVRHDVLRDNQTSVINTVNQHERKGSEIVRLVQVIIITLLQILLLDTYIGSYTDNLTATWIMTSYNKFNSIVKIPVKVTSNVITPSKS